MCAAAGERAKTVPLADGCVEFGANLFFMKIMGMEVSKADIAEVSLFAHDGVEKGLLVDAEHIGLVVAAALIVRWLLGKLITATSENGEFTANLGSTLARVAEEPEPNPDECTITGDRGQRRAHGHGRARRDLRLGRLRHDAGWLRRQRHDVRRHASGLREGHRWQGRGARGPGDDTVTQN